MLKAAIIDDADDNRDFLYYLSNGRYEVVHFSTAADALSVIRSSPPDVILLDLSLPDMSGFEVLRVIRRDPKTRRVPVPAVTAHAMAGDREKCLAAGFDDYISKPIVDVSDFLRCVDGHSGRHL